MKHLKSYQDFVSEKEMPTKSTLKKDVVKILENILPSTDNLEVRIGGRDKQKKRLVKIIYEKRADLYPSRNIEGNSGWLEDINNLIRSLKSKYSIKRITKKKVRSNDVSGIKSEFFGLSELIITFK